MFPESRYADHSGRRSSRKSIAPLFRNHIFDGFGVGRRQVSTRRTSPTCATPKSVTGSPRRPCPRSRGERPRLHEHTMRALTAQYGDGWKSQTISGVLDTLTDDLVITECQGPV